MKKIKKALALLLVLLLFASSFPFSLAEEETRLFTDSLHREVTVPARICKIAVTGPLAQMVLFALCPDKLVGLAVRWEETAGQYLAPAYYSLPLLGQLYGGKGSLNPEALLALGAEIVIDMGEAKGSVKEDMDALSEQTGIPFVHITATLDTMGEAFRLLGELLCLQTEAETLAAYCEDVCSKIAPLAESSDKPRVLYLLGADGMHVIPRGSYHAQAIDLLCTNAAEVDLPSAKGTGNETDLEQIMLWDPDVILFAPGSIYETVGNMKEWQNVSAITNGRYYQVPSGPDNWMGFPPSVQRLLGLLWMGSLFYPDKAEYDLEEEVKEYYRLFYHCELTREQYEKLMARSLTSK